MNLFTRKPSEQDLVAGIQAGGTVRIRSENQLYNNFKYLIKEASFKHKLESDDASLVYSDTVLACIEHIVSGRFEGRASLKTYLHQIFYNKCVDAIRKNSTNHKELVSLDDVLYPIPDHQQSLLHQLIKKQDHQKLGSLIANLGERCQQLLSRWADGYSDKENAEIYAYNSANVAQTTRLRCLEKLKELYKKTS